MLCGYRPHDLPERERTSGNFAMPLAFIHGDADGKQPKNLECILKPLLNDINRLATTCEPILVGF